MSIELRFNGESYGWEAQTLERGELFAAHGAFVTRAEAIAWAEAERKRSKEVPDMSLTIFGTMWADDGPVLRPHNPIQYEVRGLPPGHERVLIGQNLDMRPIRWRVLRTRDGVREWGKKDYETPGAALAALQAEFRESLETESER